MFKLITGKENLKAAFTSIKTRGAKLDKDIWIASVSAMAHHNEHGDVSLVNELVDSMPKGSRVNALREFILAFGKVTFDEENQIFMHNKEGVFNLEGSMECSWTDFKPEQPYQPIDALALIKALAKKVSNADADKGDKVTAKQAKAVMQLATDLGIDVTAK